MQWEQEDEDEPRSVEEELYAALEDPAVDAEDLQGLIRRADAEGVDIDPGLRADVDFHVQRLARFWGEDRD